MLCNKVVEKREIPNIIKRKNKTINKKNNNRDNKRWRSSRDIKHF